MVKSTEEIVQKFNGQVNMTVEELEEWLESNKSHQAGTGVGLDSGHKIVAILKKNPTKDPEKYDEEDLVHMRKVVGYNSRHLAQEDKLKDRKTKEELADTKSTISLKNWGHDPLKMLAPTSSDDAEAEGVDSDEEAEGEDEEVEVEEALESPKGEKRKHEKIESAKDDKDENLESEANDKNKQEEEPPSKSRKVDNAASDNQPTPKTKAKSAAKSRTGPASRSKNQPRKSRQPVNSK